MGEGGTKGGGKKWNNKVNIWLKYIFWAVNPTVCWLRYFMFFDRIVAIYYRYHDLQYNLQFVTNVEKQRNCRGL